MARSFDHHDESLIYDRLAKSIAGELLSDVYLETRKSMEVKNQGGLRISVKEVIVTELDLVREVGAEPYVSVPLAGCRMDRPLGACPRPSE